MGLPCICGPEWRNPNCDIHGNAHQDCVERFFTCACPGPKHGALTGCSGAGADVTGGLCAWCVAECREPLPRCTWVLATTGRCTNPATNGDVCCPCEDARDKRRD